MDRKNDAHYVLYGNSIDGNKRERGYRHMSGATRKDYGCHFSSLLWFDHHMVGNLIIIKINIDNNSNNGYF